MEAITPPKHLFSSWADDSSLIRKMDLWTSLCLGIILISVFTMIPHIRKPSRKLPSVNPGRLFDFFNQKRKKGFLMNARRIMEDARTQFPGQPYRLMTDVGETVVIPPDLVHDIRNEPGLSFSKAFADNFHPQLNGFEGFAVGNRPDGLFQLVIKKRITKLLSRFSLSITKLPSSYPTPHIETPRYSNTPSQYLHDDADQITEPLASETRFAVDHIFGKPTDWQEYNTKDTILDLICRLSSRVFLGDEVCRDEAWLAITKSYTVNAFLGAEILRPYPYWLRYAANLILPECKTLRRQVSDSRDIIEPVLQKRRDARQQAIERGEPAPKFNDGIDWFEEESQGREYDVVGAQLGLSVVAIHTTTDLLVETMLRIAENPELFDALRKEIVEVLTAEGWKKTALFNMKLMDSVLKESQRLKPVTSAIMARMATRQVTLPNGLKLQKGERCVGDLGKMHDPSIYPNPEAFNGYRFLEMRGDPKLDSQAHLVSTSPSHLGFGHGQHACPGRFFAGNELKIALAHLLMKFDWKLTPGYEHQWQEWGFAWNSDSTAKLLFRRREAPEIDIDAI
ncbi:ent-kaurene oxidase [Colletotrichum lupini]|uniref:Ent-kaurene oxidase n=1 Tax=Colletotrichum lupini TaxID=145971 RepID=A0A9Q8T6D3_9PEZI|nr:ent-kaurene oxidase [Colletotrichum lupini]UQC90079.1 ent-kaurene oxidase [Colletotrichum lupini]